MVPSVSVGLDLDPVEPDGDYHCHVGRHHHCQVKHHEGLPGRLEYSQLNVEIFKSKYCDHQHDVGVYPGPSSQQVYHVEVGAHTGAAACNPDKKYFQNI